MRFAAVGDNCIDRYLPPVNRAFAGGNAVNVAVHLKRLGHDVDYLGAIGNDADGATISACLKEQGLELVGLRVVTGGTTAYTEIVTTENGERSYHFEEFGAMATYRPDATDVARLLRMDHVHIGWLADGGHLKRQLAAGGVSVSQDLSVNNRPENLSPAGLSIAFASAPEVAAEAQLRALLEAGAKLGVITMGAAGSLASNGVLTARAGAEAVTPVDTTGAGDSFIAGFLNAYFSRKSLRKCLEAGAGQGRLACLHHGGFPQCRQHLG